jgi:hypothetical protein
MEKGTELASNNTSFEPLDPRYIASCENWEDYVSLGMAAREMKDKSQWYLGRLALAVQTKYGEKTIEKFAKEVGVAVNTLEVYRWVVSRYMETDPTFQPVPKLPFYLYQTVANMPVKERQQILEQADEGDFSVERMRLERAKREGKQIRPRMTIAFCELHKKWYFVPANLDEWEAYHGDA